MHDVTHYAWLKPDQTPDATSVVSLRNGRGELAIWRAKTPHEEAMAAGLADKADAVEVYANHGRWIVECPVCTDAQLAVRDDKRYMCPECANEAVGGKWRPVIWPKDHTKVEALLDAREHAHHRNWDPTETAADLAKENKKMGVS